jgi:hypothetical protein
VTREGVTSPAWTVIDCAKDLPFDEALAIADSALRHGETASGTTRWSSAAGSCSGSPGNVMFQPDYVAGCLRLLVNRPLRQAALPETVRIPA